MTKSQTIIDEILPHFTSLFDDQKKKDTSF